MIGFTYGNEFMSPFSDYSVITVRDTLYDSRKDGAFQFKSYNVCQSKETFKTAKQQRENYMENTCIFITIS